MATKGYIGGYAIRFGDRVLWVNAERVTSMTLEDFYGESLDVLNRLEETNNAYEEPWLY